MEAIKILAKKSNNIFQSDAWANFQSLLERKSWIIKSDNIEALVIKYPLVRDKYYFYSPKGPMISSKIKPQDIRIFLKKIQALAVQEKAIFYRVEPFLLKQEDIYKHGFRRVNKYSPLSRQYSPEKTILLDLKKDEKTLLAEMKPKWRYNINLATRKGVTVRTTQDTKDIKTFYELTQDVESRGLYHGFDLSHYQKMMAALGEDGYLRLYIAEYEGKPLAAILVSFYGQVATYLHGGSSNEDRNMMPAYACQWQAIRDAQENGMLVYDFWGISDKLTSWQGITRFKRGFGGEELEFSGAFDLPLSKTYYYSLNLLNIVRKRIRNV